MWMPLRLGRDEDRDTHCKIEQNSPENKENKKSHSPKIYTQNPSIHKQHGFNEPT